MAENKKWFRDSYFMVFIGTMIIAIAAIMSNPLLNTYQNEQIIKRIDDLADERVAELQTATTEILNNITNVTTTNQDLIKGVIEAQNITVVVGEHEDATGNETLYAELLKENKSGGTGSISGIGKPTILP